MFSNNSIDTSIRLLKYKWDFIREVLEYSSRSWKSMLGIGLPFGTHCLVVRFQFISRVGDCMLSDDKF